MNEALLLMGCVILLCTLMGRYLDRLAVPSLLIFIALGMCFGENGLLRIPFDDYDAANVICSASLIFIMFYGGFGTNLNAARPWWSSRWCCPPWEWPEPPERWPSLPTWSWGCPGRRAFSSAR